MDDAALLDIARDVVADAAVMLRQARPDEIRSKGNPKDLVTEWDTRCEERIRGALAARTPALPLQGEEAGGVATGTRWLLDPIDGTVNFAHGLPYWAISLALVDGGVPRIGVVAAPMLGWTFWARRGGGAHAVIYGDAEQRRLEVSRVASVGNALLVTGFPYDRATSRANNFGQWEYFQRRAGACRRLGTASLDLCGVARGWLDGYWERRLQPWDVAAGALIVEEAGGRVTDTRGGPFDAGTGELVATNGAIHEEMLAELVRADAAHEARP
jgi:myo-inositol-1(or 4)-monophosphatase